MNARRTIVVFLVDGQRYALPLSAVDRAVRAVAVTPLPEMPPQVLGAINVHGRVLPVLSLRPCPVVRCPCQATAAKISNSCSGQ